MGAKSAALAAAWILLTATPAAAQQQPPPYKETVTTRNIEFVTSDRVTLRADLRQPAVGGKAVAPLPTVIIKFEYNKDDSSRSERDSAAAFVEAGFNVLMVDSRGTGASEGAYCFLCRRDQQDGYEVVEWAARQPWSDGKIGMWGYSEPGVEAALTATLAPPHLKAIVPAAAYNDAYRDIIYPGGMTSSVDGAALGALFGVGVPNKRLNDETDLALAVGLLLNSTQQGGNVLVDGLSHNTYDEYWRERAYGERIGNQRVPALHVSGWDDVYPRGATLNYLAAPARDALLLGPWGHLGGAGGVAGDLIMKASIAWFDIFLRTPPGPEREAKLAAYPRVMVFDRDPSNASAPAFAGRARDRGAWRRFPSWPPPSATQQWRLCAEAADPPSGSWAIEGALTRAGACADPGSVPIAPVPAEFTGGTSVAHDAGGLGGFDDSALHDPVDQRANPTASAFVSPPLAEPATITGPATLRLDATTTGTDADWIVRLVDVGPSEARLFGRGWLRASHRAEDPSKPMLWHTHTNPTPLEPGVPYPLGIEIWPMSYRLERGHRLAVLLNAGDTQKVQPGPTGPSDVLRGVLTVPARTAPGEAVKDAPAAYTAAMRALPSGLAARRSCRSRRRLTIHARVPRGQRVARATVRVAGRRVSRRIRGRTVIARVDLHGLRRRTARVTVTMRTASGRRYTVRRRFRTCLPRPR